MSSGTVFFDTLELPADFPVAEYDETYRRIVDSHSEQEWGDFLSAWLAVAFRFRACAEYDEAFRASLGRAGNSPAQPEKYIQDRELFAFFVTGFSVLDSLCYGLYNIGYLLKPSDFPMMASTDDKRKITIDATATAYQRTFQRTTITKSLKGLVSDTHFHEWRNFRNILAHRLAPGRIVYGTTVPNSPNANRADWRIADKEIELSASTTASRRSWLVRQLTSILTAANEFTKASM